MDSGDPFRLIDVLIKHDVPLVIIGGHAVGYHGYVRATEDTDVVFLRSAEAEAAQEAAFGVHGGEAGLDDLACLRRRDQVSPQDPPVVVHRPDGFPPKVDDLLADEIPAAEIAVQVSPVVMACLWANCPQLCWAILDMGTTPFNRDGAF